ncbi:HAD-IA family hydrolase [Candidatus Bathyarchaeota archaeon]|nr:HAD-IA family hydrolase [Candidatus Bathyarchaeota archaeon]
MTPSKVSGSILFIFDVDGCIVDSFTYFKKFAPEILDKFKISVDEDFLMQLQKDIIKMLAGNSSKILVLKMINYASRKMGLGPFRRFRFLLYLRKLYKKNIRDVSLVPGAVETLKFLKTGGHRVGLFTTGSLKDFELKFENKQDLLNPVEAFIVRDDVKRTKPDPEGIFLLRERLGIDDDIPSVMIGDMVHDIEAGIDAGALPIGVLTGVNSREELHQAGAEIILDSIASIPGMMDSIQSRIAGQ